MSRPFCRPCASSKVGSRLLRFRAWRPLPPGDAREASLLRQARSAPTLKKSTAASSGPRARSMGTDSPIMHRRPVRRPSWQRRRWRRCWRAGRKVLPASAPHTGAPRVYPHRDCSHERRWRLEQPGRRRGHSFAAGGSTQPLRRMPVLAFCESQTFVQYTACLQQFVNAGASIMVDDFMFLDQDPMSLGRHRRTGTQPVSRAESQRRIVHVGRQRFQWQLLGRPLYARFAATAPTTPSPLSRHAGSSQVDSFVNQFAGGVK